MKPRLAQVLLGDYQGHKAAWVVQSAAMPKMDVRSAVTVSNGICKGVIRSE